jgi:Cu(I)/Ag(I) efflux system membrane fusion protein
MKKLIFLFAVLVIVAASSACSSKKPSNDEATQATTLSETHAMLVVQGNCEMCKERIEKAAKSVAGVSSAEWNTEAKELHLRFDEAKTSLDNISKAIAKVGYETEKDQANEEAYAALPPCCKYK